MKEKDNKKKKTKNNNFDSVIFLMEKHFEKSISILDKFIENQAKEQELQMEELQLRKLELELALKQKK